MTTQKHDRRMAKAQRAPVTIEELPAAARFSLRLRTAGLAVVSRALGVDLPMGIGDRSEAPKLTALCLGPDEWLITAPEPARCTIAAALAAVYQNAPHSLTDISDREISLRIDGPEVLTLLSIACPRDLERLEPGRAVRTAFDGVTVVLWRDGAEVFRMDIWRSFAPHVRSLLETGRTEIAAGV